MEPDWTQEEKLPLRRMLTLADGFTLFNGFLGFMAILLAAMGQVQIPFTLLIIGVLLDGVDGGLARLGYGGGRLGSKLDTLSDLVSFCIAPAFLFWNAMRDHTFYPPLPRVPGFATQFLPTALVLAACVLYLMSGTLRLARFDYLKGGERHDYFVGLTTPGAAVVLASVAYLQWDLAPSLLLVVATALLMTSRVRLPKLRGALVVPAVLLLSIAVLLAPSGNALAPLILLVGFLFYLLLGPGYVRRRLDLDESPLTY